MTNWSDRDRSKETKDPLKEWAVCPECALVLPCRAHPRPIYKIAEDISRDWKNVYFGAKPYLDAMMSLETMDQNFHQDSAKSIIVYFLSNAQSWRGETARNVKNELKGMLK